VPDQLKAGQISLIEVTPEEAKAALDAHNAKRRERHARKMQSHYTTPRKPFDFLYQQIIYRLHIWSFTKI